MRLIPITDDAEFPYEKAFELIIADQNISFNRIDFDDLIEKGRRIGWTEEMVEEHEKMRKNGKCFRFRNELELSLSGTIWEDSILFQFYDQEHFDFCQSIIAELSQKLNVRTM